MSDFCSAVTDNKGAKGAVNRVGEFINRQYAKIAAFLMSVLTMGSLAFATTTADADTMWATLMNTLMTWITRLGAIVIFIGGIQFALGWQREDSSAKTNGINTIIAGALVLAISVACRSFLN